MATSAQNYDGRVSVVQGASRGLGLEFVRQLLQQPGSVVATCRKPELALDLQKLRSKHGDRLNILQLDTTSEDSIAEAAETTAARYTHVNLLLNVSGVLHIPGVLSPETSISRVTLENLSTVFATNAFGPILVCKAFTPLLVNAAKVQDGATDEHPAVIANLSARVGSISDNRLGGWYAYRSSKAALNQLTRTMSLELGRKGQKVSSILIHPGTCNTDLSLPFQKNVAPEKLFDKERAVSQMLNIIDRTTMKENGSFFAWDGSIVPW